MPPKKSIKKGTGKKGGYKNFCKSKREEWKKAGEKYSVPEQGKMLGAAWNALTQEEKDKHAD
eukprot:CAMPEP_0183333802 /NCGR_PEP_ID=MMETSP0164_2-20130417/2592_1 /TAXON_ID=221442 /ORGANISM="Coccolithus pelagicus ssp braarudi, Strain PLY182g" /LENGTH=61 /DNA_ID=CAMNT_0025502807 /DNA_START=138 /DNA_END=323 /DNA_ORIENTATION=-